MAINSSKGFSLVELIAVITILGILASVAIPKFMDLSDAAAEASAENLAGSLGSGSAINFATQVILLNKSTTLSGIISPVPVESCADAELLLETDFPSGYTLEATEGASFSVGNLETTSCDVVSASDETIRASFTLHGVNPASP